MMNTSDSSRACPKCGATVPPEAPQGLCPQCVLAAAAAPEGAPTATSQIPSLERLSAAFPQLQVLELIGRGGMGFVFKARQPNLDRFVALKLLPDSLAQDAHFAERFNREGRTLARLNHPNIVSIFDFGQAGGFYFLLMEYVDGVNLRQAMHAGRFSPSEALTIVPKICEALQYAHEEGVLHRDIKPENILLDAKGRVKIADFGIAKIVGEEKPDVSLTATGAALGTPHYMAPEQFEKPGTVDHRADIYSLGVVFYEMLTGELPIGRFSPPSQRTPVDPRVDDVVMRTLEKEREKRFQSAGEMGTSVEHLTDAGAGRFTAPPPKISGAREHAPGGTVVIKPEDVLPKVPKWSLKAIWGAVLVAISLFPTVALLAFIFYFLANHRAPKGGPSTALLLFGFVIISLPAIAGTILGWIGLSDIRAHSGQRRGLPLATFAALAWPLLLLVGSTVVVPALYSFRPSIQGSAMPLGATLMMLVPIGTITFAIWAVYSAVRWGANSPTPQRRGILKWIFLALVFCAAVIAIKPLMAPRTVSRPSNSSQLTVPNEMLNTFNVSVDAEPLSNDLRLTFTPDAWMQFTFTAVELREDAGVRWLAIDYLDHESGDVQKAFPWEVKIPGHKPETRTSEFAGGGKDAPVRHQRVEYRMPDSARREELEQLRDKVSKALLQKTIELGLNEEKVLFEFLPPAGGSMRARVKVMAAVRTPEHVAAWVELNFATIEVQEQDNARWLMFDYMENAFGECEAAFQSATKIQFSAQVARTEFQDAGSNPSLRHRRAMFRLPDSVDRSAIDKVRNELVKGLVGKTNRFDLNSEFLLFEVATPEGQPYKAWLRVVPPREKREKASDQASTPATRGSQMVIDVWPGGNSLQNNWHFKSLIPPNHQAQVLFVRWHNGTPSVQEGQSAYFKVGAQPVEVDFFLSYDQHAPPQQADKRPKWNVNLGMGHTVSTFQPLDPPYRRIETVGRMNVQSGHQRRVPLVEFVTANDRSSPENGIDLRVLIQPLQSPAIRTLPTEKDRGTYVSGGGFPGTLEETLRLLRTLPTDP